MEFSGREFKCYSGQLSTVTSKNPSVVNTTCISSFRYTHVITYRKLRLKQTWWLVKAIQLKWNVTLNKRWNWSSCTKLALNASWTHGLISQSESVRASERNSLVAGSNPLRPTFYSYFKESIKGEYSISKLLPLHSCDYLQKTSIKTNVATDEGKRAKIKCDTEQMMKLQ